MQVIIVRVIFMVAFLLAGGPVCADDWSGVFARGGVAYGKGDLSVSHEDDRYSFGEILDVSNEGSLIYGAVGARFRLADRLYVVGKLDLYNGDLTGSRQYKYRKYGSTKFDFGTTLTGAGGGQIAYAFGRDEKLLLAVGGGVAASKVQARATWQTLGYEDSWQSNDGGAFGPYVEIDPTWRVTRNLNVFGNLKAFLYEVEEECKIGGHRCGNFKAKTTPIVATIGVEWKF